MQITITILAVIAGIALAAPRPDAPILGRHIPTIERTDVRDDSGQYAFSYSTGNGIAHVEQGALKPNLARTDNILVKQGSYAFVAPNGRKFETTYIADEGGFRVTGDHIPKDVQPLV